MQGLATVLPLEFNLNAASTLPATRITPSSDSVRRCVCCRSMYVPGTPAWQKHAWTWLCHLQRMQQ